MHTDFNAAQMWSLIAGAYFAGSIPFGLLIGKWHGIDVRKAGSGNIGATNVGRLLGKKRYFFMVFFLDFLKGLVPMLVAALLLDRAMAGPGAYLQCLAVGFAAIVGHMFSIFLRFKGGKGVATSAGVLMGFWPYFTLPGVVVVVIFLILLKTTRYMAIASVGGSSCFPVAYLCFAAAWGWRPFGAQWPLLVFAVVVPAMIAYKHRTNFARLRAGTEERTGAA